MSKIGIVIVTYNRLECLKKNLECLEKLKFPSEYTIDIVIINNNSSDGTTKYLEYFKNLKNFHIVDLEENIGGSGGFHTGVKWCIENRMDYIWGMDDDAYPKAEALEVMLRMVEKYGNRNCYWSNCNNDNKFSDEIKEVQTWMFVGFFISVEMVKIAGLPKSDYFIYHDDSEYAYRIIKKGYKIYKCRDSVIEHKDGISTYYSGKKFLGKSINNYSILPDWKRYYDVRNMLLMYSVNDMNFWKVLFIYCPKTIIAAILYNPKQLKLIFTAIAHGITRKAGIYIRP